MIIKNITIKNIRGFRNQTIGLDMIPNRPSILVAPNGSGKSSLAIAFKSLKPKSLDVDQDEIYSNNDTFVPELVLETDSSRFLANPTTNELSKEFAVFVINNQNKAKAITNNIAGTRIATARMQVAPIILIKNIPKPVTLNNSFITDNGLQDLVKGTIPSINKLLSNNKFIGEYDFSTIKTLKRKIKPIEDFIERLKSYGGRKIDVWTKICDNDIPILSQIEMVKNLVDYCHQYSKDINEAVDYLKAIQLIKLYIKDKRVFDNRIKYARYILESNSYKELFSSLKHTWKNVQPKEAGTNLIIEINDTNQLSNGERDIIVFLAMLQQAKNTLIKPNNILIIDEIFDYLDDANLVAAQYYINCFIQDVKASGRNIFPILLSHLNPNYFKTYAFNDMKVYYLNNHSPHYSTKMEKLLKRRSELMEEDRKNNTSNDLISKDLISKYMLHFHHDYSIDMGRCYTDTELNPWKKIGIFKSYCQKETEKYLNGQDYDSVAICVWLRECIEKYCYYKLSTDKQELFIEKIHGTKNKISFAEENGVACPKLFSMLGLIYNEHLHTKNKNNIDSRESLYSALENNTIREMIRTVIKICSIGFQN